MQTTFYGAVSTMMRKNLKCSHECDGDLIMYVSKFLLGGSPLRPRSNVQSIPGIFQEYSRNYLINQLLLTGRIFNGIFFHTELFVIFLFHFLMEYFRNILQARMHPKYTYTRLCTSVNINVL